MTKEATGENIEYVLYARKSTESDEKQALSIDAQVKEMQQLADKKDLNVVEVKTESHSAKDAGQREVFNEMITEIKDGKYSGLLTWAPDRLSRNAGDLGSLVDLMDKDVLEVIQTHGQRFSDAPSEKFLLMIMGSQAKLENDQKSKNVKRGLRARCEQGLWPAPPPTGYLKHPDRDKKCHVVIDPKRGPVIKKMFQKVGNKGWSGREVYRWLEDEEFETKSGKKLTRSNVYLVLKNSFYYGTFEYPSGSDNWYEGEHEPLISKQLFEHTQQTLLSGKNHKRNHKEFAFTKLMKCGNCGSGITAQEKTKELADGSIKKYTYYNCTQSKDMNCDEPYLRETDLIEQLVEIIKNIDLDESGIKEKLEAEIDRFRKFQSLLGKDADDIADTSKELDMRNYAKYILQEGSVYEKRNVLENLKNNLEVKSKKIEVIN